jgi:lambda repressor-like predicted transcriptional regulator
MAIEVMSQACAMAGREPDTVATVFSSAMGDMQITDYMCHALAVTPREISPTRFHNSVHNAPSGYWSIATGSQAPASAVSAYRYTAPMALMEAAVQVLEEGLPVLVVTQEMAAPVPLKHTCPTDRDFAAALLLAPPDPATEPLASLIFEVRAASPGPRRGFCRPPGCAPAAAARPHCDRRGRDAAAFLLSAVRTLEPGS